MKKSLTMTLILLVCICSFQLNANKRDDMYQAAMVETDSQAKMGKLEAYYNKYGKKDKYATPQMYIMLVKTAVAIKDKAKVDDYYKKAMETQVLGEADKMNVKIELAKYYSANQMPDKAEVLADELIAYAEKTKSLNPMADKMFRAPAMRIKIAILESKSSTAEGAKLALEKSLSAFRVDKSSQSAHFVHYFAVKLYNDFNQSKEAFEALKEVCKEPKMDDKYYKTLTTWLNDEGRYTELVPVLKNWYAEKKNSYKAYSLGKALEEQNIDEAMDYYAQAVAFNTDYSAKAKEKLIKLYKENKAEEKASDEIINQEVEKLVEAAKSKIAEQK